MPSWHWGKAKTTDELRKLTPKPQAKSQRRKSSYEITTLKLSCGTCSHPWTFGQLKNSKLVPAHSTITDQPNTWEHMNMETMWVPFVFNVTMGSHGHSPLLKAPMKVVVGNSQPLPPSLTLLYTHPHDLDHRKGCGWEGDKCIGTIQN